MKCPTCGRIPSETWCPDPIHDPTDEAPALKADLAEALAKSTIDEAQCNDMTEEAGRLAGELHEAKTDLAAVRSQIAPYENAMGILKADLAESVALLHRASEWLNDGLYPESNVEEHALAREIGALLSKHPAPTTPEGGE